MVIELIAELRCPYCGGSFRIARECRREAGRLSYGLLECRCFMFPVVDGILLLSLAKGYGGAEEALQPYAPLLVAALQYLQRDDVDGLKAWIRRHVPLAAELMEGEPGSYLSFATRLDLAVDREAQAYLGEMGRYEVLGTPRRMSRLRGLLENLPPRRAQPKASRPEMDDKLSSYYVARFFAPRVNALALQLGSLPMSGKVLSLCCGHGVFENLATADGRARQLISVDAQFLNLLITRRYTSPQGTFICHDVQFPLPFADGSFDGVFSSTCLPEIPAQRTLAKEAIRVAAPGGWTVFDSIWNLEMGAKRVNPRRHYRFCQNLFARLEDYIPFFDECAGPDREVGIDIPGLPEKYLGAATWVFGVDRARLVAERDDLQISVIVRGREQAAAFTSPARPWISAAQLSVSPVYSAANSGPDPRLQRRKQFVQLAPNFAPKAFPGYAEVVALDLARSGDAEWLRRQFCAGVLALLPAQFDQPQLSLSAVKAD